MMEQETTEEQAKGHADKQTSDEQDSDEKSKDDRPHQEIEPVKEKIGEARDNLRKRGEWYQRRTGGSS
jgi:uncharacterized protein YjbJ (UPF0337 family)